MMFERYGEDTMEKPRLRGHVLRFLNLSCIMYKVFWNSKQKLVPCNKQTMRLAETDHVICFNELHDLFTTRYKFLFTMSKHLSVVQGYVRSDTWKVKRDMVNFWINIVNPRSPSSTMQS